MSGATAPAGRSGLLRRLRGRLQSTPPAVANHIDASASASKTISLTPPAAPSLLSSSSLSSDPGGPLASPLEQTVHPVQQSAVSFRKDFLGRALQLLPDRDRETIENYTLTTTDDIDSALRNAFNAAQEKQKQCEDKRWTLTFRGRIVNLREEADKVLLWLDRFKQVGDIVANVDPIHVGLPWAGIRLLLQVAISESRQMAALLVGLKTALYMMNRLKAYMDYLRDLPATQTRANFEEALTQLHALILRFLAKAIQTYGKGSLTLAFDAFWKPEDLSDFESECDMVGMRVEIEASNCDRTLNAFEREGVQQNKKNLQEVLKELEELQDVKGSVIKLLNETYLAKLPCARGAAFDSHQDEHDARCLQDTRVDVRRRIAEWAEDPHGKCIFWLNGMAGTGKSTISRTVAQSFEEKGQLGASFFFKRGEGDRGNASRFFTTIATQLVAKVPRMASCIAKAIDADPAISEKALKEQFEKLVLQPLLEMTYAPNRDSTLIIVIDAIDECEKEKDIREILRLLAQAKDVRPVCLRIFVTSRPELSILLGFKEMSKMSGDTYQNLVLHEVPSATIEHDISSYLRHEFANIKAKNTLRESPYPLSEDWPGDGNIQALVKRAIPLFIFAATVCRYVENLRWNPEKRLNTILGYQAASYVSGLDRIYLPILEQQLIDQDDADRETLAREFREIVGVIIILADPLSTASLASLLDIPKEDVDGTLDSLRSVLNIPINREAPVRLLHLSFRDFLLDLPKRSKSPFGVNERETHGKIASKCLERISRPGCLKENLCSLEGPGTLRNGVDTRVIDKCLPADVQYACRYWVYHLKESKGSIRDGDEVHLFLQRHLLHWLEAMSLMGKISESIALVGILQSLPIDENTEVSHFLYDIGRFVLQNRWIVSTAPLQLYSSAIIFAPEMSITRNTFKNHIPSWIRLLPKVPRMWSLELQKLEHSDWVYAVAFSPNCKLLVSASGDSTVRLWNPATGEELQKLEGHSGSVLAVAISPNGQMLASASDKTVRLWSLVTGDELQELGHSRPVIAVAFSPNSQLLASASRDKTVRLWNPATGEELQKLEGHSGSVLAVAFSPNGQLLASTSEETVILWNPETGDQLQKLEGHSGNVLAVAFSPDSQMLASASDKTVRLWSLVTGDELQKLEGHSDLVRAVAFSPNGQLIASASDDGTVRLWNPATGAGDELQKLEGHSHWVLAVAFSPNGQLLASTSRDNTVRLWNLATEAREGLQKLKDSDGLFCTVRAIKFSPNGQLIASASDDGTVKLWDPATGEELQMLKAHSECVLAVVFSPDSQLLAFASSDTIVRLWNLATGEELQMLIGHSDWVLALAFSINGQLLASASKDKTVKLWDLATGEVLQILTGHSDWVRAVAFAPNGWLVASASNDKTVRLWNVFTGEELQKFDGHSRWIRAVAFSLDGALVAFASDDKTVRLWNLERGEQLQKLQLGTNLLVLSFSMESQRLETDKGPIYFNPGLGSEPKRSGSIFLNGDWITRAGENLLWLPHDYRGTSSAVQDNVLVIGQISGQLTFIGFDFS